MEKQALTYEDFIRDVDPRQLPFIESIHALMQKNGCPVKVEMAKSGPVLTYSTPGDKRALLNYVFRKSGLTLRIYAEHIGAYAHLLEALPEALQKRVIKAGACRRMLDPAKCNARCPMGYVFPLGGETHKKCRYNAFLLPATEEAEPALYALVARELKERTA